MDLRIAGAICRACNIQLGDLIAFEKPRAQLRQFDAKSQTRLDASMTKSNDGQLMAREKKEFAQPADKAHRMSMENARVLQAEWRRSDHLRAYTTARAGDDGSQLGELRDLSAFESCALFAIACGSFIHKP